MPNDNVDWPFLDGISRGSIEFIKIVETVPALVGGGVGRDAHALACEKAEAKRGLTPIREVRETLAESSPQRARRTDLPQLAFAVVGPVVLAQSVHVDLGVLIPVFPHLEAGADAFASIQRRQS